MSITIGGTYSGLNVSSIISAIIAADSIPITNLQSTNTTLSNQSSDLGSLGSSLGTLSTQLQAISTELLEQQAATSSSTSVGSASVDSSAASGTTNLDITQVSTTTVLRGGSSTGAYADAKLTAPPAADANIGSVLNESSVNGETFTINGKQITLASSDTLNDVINKITNSGAGVTASYNSSTGIISLSSSSTIILGSATDSSDFLQQAQLFNNSTGSVTSAVGIGRVDPSVALSTAGLRTAPTAGTFTINGVPISYSSGDSLNTVLSNINSSGAGVTAIYDTYEDQVVLSSSQRGPQNITVSDGTSNLATALRLTSTDSQLQTGSPTLFTVGSDPTVRQSSSNVLTSSELGVPGLTFTATGTGATQVAVAPDTTAVATAINAFVTQYNSTQSVINSYTAVDTSNTAQNGSLATDTNLTFLAPQLRSITSGSVSNTATIRMLSDLGVDTNANDNTLTQVDPAKLQDALTNHLSDVVALFEDPTGGLTNTVQSVLSSYNDSLNGVIVDEQSSLKQQISFNQSQITAMQERITVEQTALENEFAQLDTIESQSAGVSSILSGSSSTGATASTTSSSSSSFGSVGGLS